MYNKTSITLVHKSLEIASKALNFLKFDFEIKFESVPETNQY